MMTGPTPSDHKRQVAGNMLAEICRLQAHFRQRAAATREARRLPLESVQELQDAGFFLALQPQRFGGYELAPQDFFRMQCAIAEGCMSTAWAAGIVAVHAFQLALMGAIVPKEGYRTFLVPQPDYVIEDTWYSMGLQGTGSNDIVVEDVFVPDYRTHKQVDGFTGNNPGIALNTAPLYRLPWAQTFIRVVSTPAIGAAREGLRLYREAVKGKASGDITKLAGDVATLERIAFASHEIDGMEALLYRNFDNMMAAAERNEATSIEDRALYRYQASLVIEKSIGVIDALFSSAGGASVFAGSEIQQRFLDIHTARAHVANNPTSFARNLGALKLGAENQDMFI